VINALTQTPANILEIDAGTLNNGESADFCIVEKQDNTLDQDTLLSSGKNSPYFGKKVGYQIKHRGFVHPKLLCVKHEYRSLWFLH